jgi:hypothetical protein
MTHFKNTGSKEPGNYQPGNSNSSREKRKESLIRFVNNRVFLMAYLLVVSCWGYSKVIYVDIDATGSDDGTSWTNAFTNLHEAIDSAVAGDEIWVAEGTYVPNRNTSGSVSTNNVNNTFYIDKDSIGFYGGFNGTETTRTQRDLSRYVTILSGDMDNDGNLTDNAEKVVYMDGSSNPISSETVFDGFVVEHGYATNGDGSGMYLRCGSDTSQICYPIVRNCLFRYNTGAYGAGLMMQNTSYKTGGPTVENCIFYSNDVRQKGCLVFKQSEGTITNCTFFRNYGKDAAGLFFYYANSSALTIRNCIIWKNFGNNGNSTHRNHAILKSGPNTPTVEYCLFESSHSYSTGTGCFYGQSPSFRDSAAGDLRLNYDSPAKDAGTSTGAPSVDYEGLPRPVGSAMDIGAYEFRSLFVDHAATGAGDGTTWEDAYTTLQQALDSAGVGVNGNQILIAEGTYKPAAAPSGSAQRDYAFHFSDKDVVISGGWDASEGTQTGSSTILSGDVDESGINDAYHILVMSDVTSATSIEDVTMKKALGNGTGTLTYDSKTISDKWGAAVVFDGSAEFRSVTFEDNEADSGTSIYAEDASLYLEDCIFSGDTSSKKGIVFVNGSTVTAYNSVFKNNETSDGGALYINTGSTSESSALWNCAFTDNTVSGTANGPALYLDNSPADLFNCVFEGNSTNNYGGAMYAFASSTSYDLELTNCNFINNSTSASTAGGGFSYRGLSPTISNCLFFRNTANSTSNAIYEWTSSNGLKSGSTHNASDVGTSCPSNIGSGFLNIDTSTYADLFYDSIYPAGVNLTWFDNDDGFVPQDGIPESVLIGAGSSSAAPSEDITGFSRPANPSIGAYEVLDICRSDMSLPTTASTTYVGDYKTTDADGWTHYCSSDDKLLLSLKLDGTGAVVEANQVRLKLGSSTTYGYGTTGGLITNSDGYEIIDRLWDVSPTTQPSGNVGVRYYFTNDEYSDLVSALSSHLNSSSVSASSTISSASDLEMYKATSALTGQAPTAFSYPHNVYGIILSSGSTPATDTWKHSNHNGGADHVAEFEVSSFSGGGGGGGGGGGAGAGSLPVQLIEFNAVKQQTGSVLTTWSTASEIDNSHFLLKRSYDGIDFKTIAMINGQGTTNEVTTYEHLDINVNEKMSYVYYQLVQVDYNGTLSQSEIVKLRLGEEINTPPNMVVQPNPFIDDLHVVFDKQMEEDMLLEIFDLSGKLVYSQHIVAEGSSRIIRCDLSNLRNGSYIVSLRNNNEQRHYRIVKK